ncbi:MAG TPA: IS1182 family transposase [Burkholderiales bacterium]|jgi:transposase|nr:IS1182 family transposase [Burkholderiales bacterium]
MTNEARFIRADRAQTRWDFIDLEELLPRDHRARIVMSFVEGLDLSALYDAIKAREGEPGRPPPDPAVLMGLWLYATIEGVGSARQLERLARSDLAYRWISGGVPLNYHGLADFRVAHVAVLDRLLSESVAALIKAGVISLAEVVVDGTKVRANASRDSFKTGKKLARIDAAVEQRLAALKAEIEADPKGSSQRRLAVQERAAREVKERAERARMALDKVRSEKEKRAKTHPQDEAKKKSEPKVSLSDPSARMMRFADGAVRPGYNAQIAATPREGIIISVAMTDRRNDAGLAMPMVEDMVERYGKVPQVLLLDTHYATSDDIAALASHAAGPVTVFAPLPPESDDVKPRTLADRKRARAREPESVKEWRSRMETQAGQDIYGLRKLIERLNAHLKNHGFGFMPVRGLIKVKAVALWHALASNLLAAHRLRAKAA